MIQMIISRIINSINDSNDNFTDYSSVNDPRDNFINHK